MSGSRLIFGTLAILTTAQMDKAAKQRGRPKTAKGQRQLKTTLRFHPDELDKIKAAAKAKKTKTATFIRDAALDAAELLMST